MKKYLVLTILASVLLGCSKSTDDINQEAVARVKSRQASFSPSEVTGSAFEHAQNVSMPWKEVYKQKRVEFKTCLKDHVLLQPIPNERFIVKTDNREINVISDINGCIKWSKELTVNNLVKPKFSETQVQIIGSGDFRGNYALNLAINPWLDGSAAVQDLDYTSIDIDNSPINLKEFSINENMIASSIVFNRLKEGYSYTEDGAVSLNYEFKMLPLFRSYTFNGVEKFDGNIFIDAPFSINLKIIAKADEGNIAIGSKDLTLTTDKQGYLKGEIQIPVNQNINVVQEEAFLALTITPNNAPTELSRTQGIVPLQFLDKNTSDKLFPVKELHQGYYTEKKEVEEEVNPQVHQGVIAFDVKKIDAQFASLGTENYRKSFSKNAISNIKLCFTDPFSPNKSAPLNSGEFLVDFSMKGKQIHLEEVIIKNNDSCVFTKISVPFNSLSPNEWIKIDLKITQSNTANRAKSLLRTIAINPGQQNNYAKDLAFESIEEVNNKNQSSKLSFSNIEYSYLGNDQDNFKVNKYLSLSLNKKYAFSFRPTIDIYNPSQDETTPTPLTYGKYKLTFGVYGQSQSGLDLSKHTFKKRELISSVETIVEVNEHGVVNTVLSLPLSISDTQLLVYPHIGALYLEPVDKIDGLESATRIFEFKGLAKSENTYAFQTNLKNSDLKTDIARLESKLPLSPFQTSEYYNAFEFFKESQLARHDAWETGVIMRFFDKKELNRRIPDINYKNRRKGDYKINEFEWAAITSKDEAVQFNTLKKFCGLYFDKPRDLNSLAIFDCLKNPSAYLEITYQSHVQEVLETKEKDYTFADYIESESGKITRGHGFYAAQGLRSDIQEGHRSIFGRSIGGVIGFQFGKFGLGGEGGVGMEYSYDEFTGETDSQMQSVFGRSYTNQAKPQLQSDVLTLEFKAMTKTCALITPKKKVQFNQHIHLCSDELTEETLQESWFFIGNTNVQNGVIADGVIQENKAVRSYIIRGAPNFEVFWKKYEKEDTKLMSHKFEDDIEVSKSFTEYLEKDVDPKSVNLEVFLDNAYPGLYIHTKN